MDAPLYLGITGRREAGKTTVATYLQDKCFIVGHPFNPGKAATEAYFLYLGMPVEVVRRSVYGDLKDVPNTYLPGKATPRTWMERLGKWMPAVMGVEWTIGVEVAHLRRLHPHSDLVFESLVYESTFFRSLGGVIIRIVRPGHAHPECEASDEAQARIDADFTLINDGDRKHLYSEVCRVVDAARAARNSGVLSSVGAK